MTRSKRWTKRNGGEGFVNTGERGRRKGKRQGKIIKKATQTNQHTGKGGKRNKEGNENNNKGTERTRKEGDGC